MLPRNFRTEKAMGIKYKKYYVVSFLKRDYRGWCMLFVEGLSSALTCGKAPDRNPTEYSKISVETFMQYLLKVTEAFKQKRQSPFLI